MRGLRAVQPHRISAVDFDAEHLAGLLFTITDGPKAREDWLHVATSSHGLARLVEASLGDRMILRVELEVDGVAYFGFDVVRVHLESAIADFDSVGGCGGGDEGEERCEDDR